MAETAPELQLILVTESQLRAIVADELRKVLGLPQTNAEQNPAQEEYLNQTEAMALLGIARPTIIRWTKRGLIEAIKIGRTVRYRRSDLLRAQKSE